MKLSILPLILLSIVLNSAAQIFLKAGMNSIEHLTFPWINFYSVIMNIAINPLIILGFLIYGTSLVLWIFILSRTPVSVAYPMISIGYIVNAIFAYFLLGETLALGQLFGIFLILIGTYFVATKSVCD